MRAALLALAVGCAPDPADTGEVPAGADCFAEGAPRLEMSLESGVFGGVTDGLPVPVSTPPQGGAPYTPWTVRVTGDGALHLGVRMVATATDGDEVLGDATLDISPICANVDPNDGWWILTGVHVRYWNYGIEALRGRTADVHFSLQDPGGGPERVGADVTVVLGGGASGDTGG